MIILNTTFHCLPGKAAEDVIAWLRGQNGRIYAIRTELPEESEGIALQQDFKTIEDAERAADELAALIATDFKERLGKEIIYFSTYLEQL